MLSLDFSEISVALWQTFVSEEVNTNLALHQEVKWTVTDETKNSG